MSSPATQPHLVSLVLQSKKALQNGEQLCSRAHTISNASANTSIDVLALDAKVRWVTEAVQEQLKLVASEWDKLRAKHSDELDNILESLGCQLVPPDFHQSTSADSSLFGSQHSEDQREHNGSGRKPNGSGGTLSAVSHSPSSTLRAGFRGAQEQEREKGDRISDKKFWKTLRDFVDDQAIEDVLETIENDRLSLDYIMSKTDEYPETLATTIKSIEDSLPELLHDPPMKFTDDIIAAQDLIITSMTAHLESLTSHYGQMANALQDIEVGETFSDEDLQAMNRDTEELPSIMAELEENADSIEEY
ncbi:hypothetical protein H0H81_000775 [Sphagnurus paluster]|uniref:Autophagy-related protein 17 n=1 Tax=Sphagnurus paluster TaxID=117069 RepID=A0A9P7GRR8_9AGAR|nr:hypothetical protein H0H81_000775 [Sphagnurus paluster]